MRPAPRSRSGLDRGGWSGAGKNPAPLFDWGALPTSGRKLRQDLAAPVATLADARAVHSGEAQPRKRAVLALRDVEALVVVGDEQPLVVVDLRVGGLAPETPAPVTADGPEIS